MTMATTVTPVAVDSAQRSPGLPSCCPAAPTRSSTCRPMPAPTSSAPSGATPTPTCTRSTSSRSGAARGRPARPGRRPQPHLRRRAARAGTRLRRLRLGAADARRHAAAALAGPRVLQLVPHPRHDPRTASATSTRPAPPSSSRSPSTTTPRCGSTARCRSRSVTRAARSSAASTRPTASCSRATRGRATASRSPYSASTARSPPRRTTTSGCAPRRSTSTRASARESHGLWRSSSSAWRAASTTSPVTTRASSRWPAASSSPRGRCGAPRARVEPHGNTTVMADRYQGRRLNSPNDLVHRSDGTLFFTDPPFGLPGVFDDPARELPFSGVFAVHEGE